MSNKQFQIALKEKKDKEENKEKKEEKETTELEPIVTNSSKKLENIFSQLENEEVKIEEGLNGPKFSTEMSEEISIALNKNKDNKKKKKKKKESDYEIFTKEIETEKKEITKELPNSKIDSIEYKMIDSISNKITDLEKELKQVYDTEKELKEKGKLKESLIKYEELLTQQMIKLDLIQGSEDVRLKKKEQIRRLHKILDPLDEKIAQNK